MPPKAHAKAKAAGKAKARPVRLHRPAARMRRPAAREGLTLWEQGLEGPLCDIPPMALRPGALLVVTEGDYFGEKIQVAGEVMKLEVDQGDTTVQLRLKGTRSEAILRVATANPQKLFHCHVCPAGCPRQAVGDFLIHGVRGRPLDRGKDEGWTGNLEAGEAEAGAPDEMEELRRRSQHLAQEAALPGGRAPGEADRGAAPREAEEDKREAKSKKKKKKDKREKDYTNGRHPAVAVQKDLKDVFSGTGLDPRERQRRRVLSGARKFALSKKAKSSSQSSDSNTSSSSSTHEDYKGQETVFSEETKVKGIAERFPGALTMEAVTSMRQSLLTTSGEDLEDRGVRPIATLYYRSILACRTTGVQSRELLKPIGGAGLPIERQNSVCRRHSISKTQGTRVSGPGHELGHSPKTGSSSYGVGWPGGYHRAEPGAARRLQRGQDAVEDSDVFGCQGRVQGQRKRSEERYVAKGREAGGEGRQERKGQGEKVNYPPEQKAYDRRGEAMEGITPEGCAGVGSDRGGDRAALNRPGLLLPTGAVHPLAVGPGSSLSFSLSPPKDISGGVQADVMSAPFASFFSRWHRPSPGS